MSRYYDGDGDENFPNEAEFWRTNAERAMKGKRGRKALADLREALLALPEKRLISDALCTVARTDHTRPADWIMAQGEGVCAVGAYAWHKKVKAGMDPTEAFESLPTLDSENNDIYETEIAGVHAGLTRYVAWELAYRNDENFTEATPEERYERFLAWLDAELAVSA